MKGTITPGDKFVKINKIMEASSLNVEMEENNTVLSAELQVVTMIAQALIVADALKVTGRGFSSDEALINKAKSMAKKILGKKDLD